ncbi:MAG TPA: amino acid adenylation domain-containing protein [Thermoanaerobaculia bacterium]|jgi:non-ribosomal peptide synthetase-like protein|nr:amino acid adenylation domain-containing protein [Thermoanaerobaculia bacterium]
MNPEIQPVPETGPQLLHEIFEGIARRMPNQVAIEVPPTGTSPRRRFTYAEIDAQADALAARLAPFVHRESVVAILLPRRDHLIYVAQLAVMKAGGAYTCLERTAPAERLRFVLEDSQAVAAITSEDLRTQLASLGYPAEKTVIANAGPATESSPVPTPPWLTPSTLVYVIYTSGTTGNPKGVMVEHRSVVNLVLSDSERFGLGPQDRCGQSSSAAYDSSVEEMWLAFAVGATLVVMNDDVVRLGPDLVPWLRDETINVFCPPPTLLRMCACDDPEHELPDLNLLYLGGEELPADVANRWAPGRWLENGYGPTECTVTVVRTRVYAGEPVTIGKPLRGALAWALDAELGEVPRGEVGELCIGGIAVTRGYLNRPDLTHEKFVDHPRFGRIYRSGDLVRELDSGDFVYLGRSDAQVKIRGHRIELSAVEAELCTFPGVVAAACKVQTLGGVQELVAFLVADPAAPPDLDRMRADLRERLPEPMLPVRYGFVEKMPASPSSGKLNRAALPDLLPEIETHRDLVAPRSAAERAVARAFSDQLRQGAPVSIHDDFFLDLGGNSLLAAQAISSLRKHELTSALTVRDVYEARTVAELAARVAGSASPEDHPDRHRAKREISRLAPVVSLVQLAWILGTVLAGSVAAWLVAFRLLPAVADDVGITGFLLLIPAIALAGLAIYAPLALLVTVTAKKLLIGRYCAGRYPYMGSLYLRNWIVQQLARLIPWELIEGTVFKNGFLRALGARIGKDVHIHRGVDLRTGGWDLLEIGDGATIGRDASLGLVELEDQEMLLGPVTLGAGCTLDTRARMAPHSTMEAGAVLTSLSTLTSHATIPAGELWNGVPAAFEGPAPPAPAITQGRAWPASFHGVMVLLARGVTAQLAFLPLAVLAAVCEHFVKTPWLETLYSPSSYAAAPILIALAIVVAGFFLALPVEALAVRLVGSVRPGTYSLYGWTSLVVFIKESLLESAGNALSGTLLWPGWLRAAGMKVGRKCEISTIMEVIPELIEIGEESFFADGIYLGRPWLHRGTITCAKTTLSKNTFLGNHVVIPGGSQLPTDILIGISTVADASRIRPGTSWFGHPLIELPRREVVESDRRLTHDPAWYRYVNRLFWEYLRGLIPIIPAFLGILWFKVLPHWRATETRDVFFALTLPGFTMAEGACLVAIVLVSKWLLLGRVREGRHPLWSCWCSRWDFLYVLWAAYVRGSLTSLEGTPFMIWWLRAIGARIGRRVVLGTRFAQVVDPDMLIIDDDATVSCLLQLHSFEDRVLKIAPARFGARSTVGNGAVLLYGANIGEGARVEDGSVVMKHETLLPGQYYVGAPTRPARPPEAARLSETSAPALRTVLAS